MADHGRTNGQRRVALSRLAPIEPHRDAYPSDLAVLEALTPRDRALLYLHDVEGLPYRDIAGVIGGREASLRRAATRARKSLRRLLTEGEVDATN